jgi:hypothetical protein
MASNAHLFGHGPADHFPMQANCKQTHASKLSARVVRKTGRSHLGIDFRPTEHSVICGRGRQHDSIGNRRFRLLAGAFVERYSRADRKTTKAALVFDIITMIRQAGGNFCKYENGAWFEVGDHCARGKVSACFRDMLHTQYRSSAKSKTTRRSLLNRKKKQAQPDGQQLLDGTGGHRDDSSTSSSCAERNKDSLGLSTSKAKTTRRSLLNGKKKQTQLHGRQLLDGTGGYCDDSSMSSSCAGGSKNSLGFDSSVEIDCSDIDAFYSSTSTPFSGSSTDSLGFECSLEIEFFDIDVF